MKTNEKDYWQEVGEPGFAFDKSIMRNKAFAKFLSSKSYLNLKNNQATKLGKSAHLLSRICNISMIFFVVFFIILLVMIIGQP